jgi:hypothetical protein
VLLPLCKALEFPEAYMSTGNWDEIPYDHITPMVMHQYKYVFTSHVKKRVADIFNEDHMVSTLVVKGHLAKCIAV